MAKCVTCGVELHPERAAKYDYCTDRACQEKNAKGLTVLAVGVNKAADLYEIVDERTREKVARGTYVEKLVSGSDEEQRQSRRTEAEQRLGKAPRASRTGGGGAAGIAGTPAPTKDRSGPREGGRARREGPRSAERAPRPGRAGRAPRPATPGTRAQQSLALIYSERGMRPDEIAEKLGLSASAVIQIILAARNRPRP
jgi:hypothetical protein